MEDKVVLTRLNTGPLLKPRNLWWEERGIFNPGATIFQNKVLLLYRSYGKDEVSRFGVATSSDGINFTHQSDKPVFSPDPESLYEKHGVEDPRISFIDGRYAIVYTAAGLKKPDLHVPSHGWKTRVSLAWTEDFQNFTRQGVILHSYDDKDAALFPKKWGEYYYLYHRRFPSIWLSRSMDLNTWEDIGEDYTIIEPDKDSWDSDRVGIGSQPILTPEGWLIFYHGRSKDEVYRIGAFIADRDNPAKILYKMPYALLEPERSFEKQGKVSNVVFSCGAVEAGEDFIVYYGGADFSIGGAYVSKAALLKELKKYPFRPSGSLTKQA